MEHTPQITALPTTATTASQGSGPAFAVDSPVTLTVARSEATLLGHVIVTFAKKGPLTCKDLLNCKTTSELLAKAEAEGVTLDEPALLATIDDQGVARTVYLTPTPENNFRGFAVWVGMITETLTNLKAAQVGIYLCKNSLEADALCDLMGQGIRSLVESKVTKNICLVVGQHAYNEILTMALNLKNELDGANASVHVLH